MGYTGNDLRTARDRSAHASRFVFPLFRNVWEGGQALAEVISVTTRGELPDGRWLVEHGPSFCMAAKPEDWIVFAPDLSDIGNYEKTKEERRRWEEFLNEATFSSLDAAIDAAVAGQRKSQAELDALPAREPDTGAYRAPEVIEQLRREGR